MYKLCPTCRVKVTKIDKLAWFLGGLTTIGCFMFLGIGLLFIPLLPITLFLPTRYMCSVCKHYFKENELLIVDKLG